MDMADGQVGEVELQKWGEKSGMTHNGQGGGNGNQGGGGQQEGGSELPAPAHACNGSGKPRPWVSWGRGF